MAPKEVRKIFKNINGKINKSIKSKKEIKPEDKREGFFVEKVSCTKKSRFLFGLLEDVRELKVTIRTGRFYMLD